jgi:hypothetical protein
MSYFADQEEKGSQMRYEMLIAAILALSQAAASASFAQDRSGLPRFTAEETRTVSRNEVLQALIETDPWLVRDFLDALAQRQAADTTAADAADQAAGKGDDPATAHPDAASVEWLDLLRQLRDDKAAGRHDGTAPSTTSRSAAGSLELLEALKQARKGKDAAK